MSVAIVVLGQQSVALAHQIKTVLPDAIVYGLVDRTTNVEISYTNFGETLRQLFTQGTPIIGICAAGILIRTLAPVLVNKFQEPPVLAIAEDGSAVVPLLGGLHGVNDLARLIATGLQVAPAITTTGDLRFRTALLSPPPGYRLANPDDAKTFIADLLAGATVKLVGLAPWLSQSQLPIDENGPLTLQITAHLGTPGPHCLVYHPTTIALGIDATISLDPPTAIALLQQTLAAANLAPAAIAAVCAQNTAAAHPSIQAIAQWLQVPVRCFTAAHLAPTRAAHPTLAPAATIALTATPTGTLTPLINSLLPIALAHSPQPLDPTQIGTAQGKLAIVGTGPGSPEWMSPQVRALLHSATDWVGYSTYLNLVEPLRTGQQRHDSDNRVELDRARLAIDLAAAGRSVVVVSSGDPGIYAMASAVFEVLDREAKPEWAAIEIQVAPGISALQAAAAQTGAPIGHDFCAISLSDILKPWATIEQRITAAAQADLVIAFYNPVSQQRTWQLDKARQLLLQSRSAATPVVLARNLGRPGQAIDITTLAELDSGAVDMRTIVLVGSSKTRTIPRPYGGVWVYTPRHYELDGGF